MLKQLHGYLCMTPEDTNSGMMVFAIKTSSLVRVKGGIIMHFYTINAPNCAQLYTITNCTIFFKLIFGLVLVNATVDAECTSGSVNFALATCFAERYISNLLINFNVCE